MKNDWKKELKKELREQEKASMIPYGPDEKGWRVRERKVYLQDCDKRYIAEHLKPSGRWVPDYENDILENAIHHCKTRIFDKRKKR